ncbi:MAG: ribonuclease HII [Candidatus Aenigmarchaeota archaeon]|jgi:ribonuclease HII|nr:ribonuclease HII [Candidatus Aenigmarchaeota archaeon]
MIIAGIDEAGRGAVIGPMVLAGVSIESKDSKKLKKMGIRDSKELTPEKREELAKELERMVKEIVVIKVSACKISSFKAKGINLDKLEAMKIADIISILKAEKVYVDSIEQNCEKFERMIREFLPRGKSVRLVVKNYLDESVPIVSAASIIAKVERDREIEKIKRKVNFDFGVGYSHDERTRVFIEKILQTEEAPPPYLRIHWETVEDIARKLLEENKKIKSWVFREVLKQDSWQKKIKDFIVKKIIRGEEN